MFFMIFSFLLTSVSAGYWWRESEILSEKLLGTDIISIFDHRKRLLFYRSLTIFYIFSASVCAYFLILKIK